MITSLCCIVVKRFTDTLKRPAIIGSNGTVEVNGEKIIVIQISVTAWDNQEINK